jgi:hypothetical protein
LHDCYECQRARVAAGKIQDRLSLVEWCIRHELYREAESELAAARTADPTNLKLGLFERRLQLARERPTKVTKPTSTKKPIASDELDRILRELPRGSMETFTTSIQPFLLNHCATAACHGPGAKSALRFLRPGVGRPLTRRATQRNLYAILSTLDAEQHDEATLADSWSKAHADNSVPVLSNRESAQYGRLARWLCLVTGTPSETRPATVDEPDLLLLQSSPGGSARDATDGASEDDTETADPATPTSRFRDFAADAVRLDPRQAHAATRAEIQAARARPALGQSVPDFAPRDAFDPEIFNRRFFAE